MFECKQTPHVQIIDDQWTPTCYYLGMSCTWLDLCVCHVVLPPNIKDPSETRNPAHRRPWLKMKIEYHPTLIFCAFVRGFLKFQVYTLFVAEFHWKVSKMAVSPQQNDDFNLMLFWNDVTTLSMPGFASFFPHLTASILRQEVFQVFQKFAAA